MTDEEARVTEQIPVVAIRNLKTVAGQTVRLQGWLQGKRAGGKVVFLQVRDGTGLCQCVVEAAVADAFEKASGLTK